MHSTRAMEEEGFGKSWLGLGIGGGGGGCDLMKRSRPPVVQFDLLFPQSSVKEEAAVSNNKIKAEKVARKRRLKQTATAADDVHQQSSSHGGPSPSDDDDDDEGAGAAGAGTRKKLRLTREQSTLLEDTFRAHNILSHAQKQELARQVNLSARQVEVWFQNRRARTKLKQTEVDCEILKRCCDSLTGENQRLRLELAQLQRSAAAAGRLYVQHQQFPPPTTAMAMASVVCPSCDKVTVTSGGEMASGKSSTSYSS